MSLRELSTRLKQWRCERPDEWTMDEFIRLASALEYQAEQAAELRAELAAANEQLAKVREQEPVLDNVLRDAARYRFLRRKVCVIGRPELSYPVSVFDFVNLPRPDYSGDCFAKADVALDFAIDASLLAAAQEGKK